MSGMEQKGRPLVHNPFNSLFVSSSRDSQIPAQIGDKNDVGTNKSPTPEAETTSDRATEPEKEHVMTQKQAHEELETQAQVHGGRRAVHNVVDPENPEFEEWKAMKAKRAQDQAQQQAQDQARVQAQMVENLGRVSENLALIGQRLNTVERKIDRAGAAIEEAQATPEKRVRGLLREGAQAVLGDLTWNRDVVKPMLHGAAGALGVGAIIGVSGLVVSWLGLNPTPVAIA